MSVRDMRLDQIFMKTDRSDKSEVDARYGICKSIEAQVLSHTSLRDQSMPIPRASSTSSALVGMTP